MSDLRRALADGGKAAVTGFTSARNLLGVSLRGGIYPFAKIPAAIAYLEEGHARGKVVVDPA